MAKNPAKPADRAEKPAKPATRRRAKAKQSPSADEIAVRAYYMYETEGGGDPVEHWLRAERDLAAGALA